MRLNHFYINYAIKCEDLMLLSGPGIKTSNTSQNLTILPSDRLAYIKKLTADNYHSGPKKDNYDPTEPDYYEFGIEIKGTEVYIKISIGQYNKLIDCMSFHKAERAMLYPLR